MDEMHLLRETDWGHPGEGLGKMRRKKEQWGEAEAGEQGVD